MSNIEVRTVVFAGQLWTTMVFMSCSIGHFSDATVALFTQEWSAEAPVCLSVVLLASSVACHVAYCRYLLPLAAPQACTNGWNLMLIARDLTQAQLVGGG